jgi:hypothetical protein
MKIIVTLSWTIVLTQVWSCKLTTRYDVYLNTIYKASSYISENKLRVNYKAQYDSAASESNGYFFWETYEVKQTLCGQMQRF